MKKFFILFCWICFSALTLAQNGSPLLSHYREYNEIENQSWAICQDDNGFMMFANRRGILTYDGSAYDLLRLPVIPYSLSFSKAEKRVYVGAENDFGYLARDEKGIYRYNSLAAGTGFKGIVTKIVFADSAVCFYSETGISIHRTGSTGKDLLIESKPGLPFTGMFTTEKNTFINVFSKGLYRLESDTLFPIVTGYMLSNAEVLFSLPYNERLVLLGIDSLGSGTVSLFDGIKFYPYNLDDKGYLKENILSDGIVVNDSLYAFSTFDGGVVVSARKSGKVHMTINYQRGLPDDEVFALGSDRSNGLWISHQYGLTRAELLLPVANFGIYPGLRGNLISSLWHNGRLYVATSEGVFTLVEIPIYVDEVITVRNEKSKLKPAARRNQEVKISTPAPVTTPQSTQTSTRSNIFSRIFGKKNPVEEQAAPAIVTVQVPVDEAVQKTPTSKEEPEYTKKTVRKLSSVSHGYVKIEGLDEKCRQMIPAGDEILATTNQGIFSISGTKAIPIVRNRYINYLSSPSEGNRYYSAAADGYFWLEKVNGKWTVTEPDDLFGGSLYSIVYSGKNTLWAGSDNLAVRITLPGNGEKPLYKTYSLRNEFPQRYMVAAINDTVTVFTESGIAYYSENADSLIIKSVESVEGTSIGYVLSQPDMPWIKAGDSWKSLNTMKKISRFDNSLLKIFDDVHSINVDDRYIWIIDGQNQLYRIIRNRIESVKPELGLFLKSISNDSNMQFRLSEIVFGSNENSLNFEIVAPGYIKQKSVQYQHIVEKLQTEWSSWTAETKIQLYLPPGNYVLKVRAKDIWGNISDEKVVPFTIKKPFTKSSWFFLLVAAGTLGIIVLVVWFRERQLQKENRILEQKVKERTAEIEAQKGEITSSIEYAGRIQIAMLPSEEHFSEFFPESFILFRPRDIVSGDFYWMGEDENHIFFTVADCTGHGVPGAFMSTLGISTLNEIITNKKDLHANTVLNLLREKIKNSLHQTGKEGEAADGMDMAFCLLHKDRSLLEYSGAYNPLLIIQNGELKEYKADRMPIGIYIGEKESFTNYEINVKKGDTLYLFSDGFTDQFGGTDGAKFKKANLKKLLAEIHQLPMEDQKRRIVCELDKWKGKNEQTDDITIVGMRV